MKKLIVLVAVLFISVSSYAATSFNPFCENYAFDQAEYAYALSGGDGFIAGEAFQHAYDSCIATIETINALSGY